MTSRSFHRGAAAAGGAGSFATLHERWGATVLDLDCGRRGCPGDDLSDGVVGRPLEIAKRTCRRSPAARSQSAVNA